MPEISKTYEPQSIEEKWYADWLEKGCFTANPASSKPAYSIVIPPPNVTGVLTLGHVLNNTIQDILARRARMLGKEVLWLPGTDHAGIATQNVVEKSLRKAGEMKHRDDLGREKLVEKIWGWKDEYGGRILRQLRALGASCDWSRTRFTMDPEYSACVQRVFVDLYKKGLIYRGKRMVNWDPVALTALSDEEVIMKPSNGFLYYFKVEVEDAPGTFLTIATTRPETIPGDTAIAVHPNDVRYAHLIGKFVRRPLPLENQALIPIVAEEGIDLAFGTGVLKVTPAHDKTDFEIGRRHHLEAIEVIDASGVMTAQAGVDLAGLDRFEARKKAVELLRELGFLEKEEPYQNNVGYSERADVPVEPRLSEQWFLKYPSVEKARGCVEQPDSPKISEKILQVIPLPAAELSGDRAGLRLEALEIARLNGWIGRAFLNNDTGWQISIRRKSLSHPFNNRDTLIIRAVAVLPQLIESAVLIRSEAHKPPHPRLIRVHHFIAALETEGQVHPVPITVKQLADGRMLCDFTTKRGVPGGKPLGAHSLAGKLGLQPAPSTQIKLADLLPAVDANDGKMRFYPDRWAKVYEHWLDGLQDWCISRQLWWGHRIPVWRASSDSSSSEQLAEALDLLESADPQLVAYEVGRPTKPTISGGNWVATEHSIDSIQACISPDAVELISDLETLGFAQDPDVLDTWFSSWLWPFATMGWPGKTPELAKFYPTTDLVTGPDIIFFWVARMIMAGYEWMGEMPFRNVYFTGIIRDKQGRKMSKSLGNSPDPLDIIAKYGADALRFGVMRSAPLGADVMFDEKNVELGRNFCTKLWNAARFRQMYEGETEGEINPALLTVDDRWILLRLDVAIREISAALDEYRFSDAAQVLYRFFWSEYCDWYLEAAKAALGRVPLPTETPVPPEQAAVMYPLRANTLGVIDFVLAHTLRLMHPFLPFITEELWESLGFRIDLPENQGGDTIMFARWPEPLDDDFQAHYGLTPETEKAATARYDTVLAGRNLRSTYHIPSNKRVRFVFQPSGALAAHDAEVLKILLNAEALDVSGNYAAPPGTPMNLTPLGNLFLPLKGLVDVTAERERLDREIAKVEDELAKVRAKLANPGFTAKVPASVLEEHRQRDNSWQEKLDQLQKMRSALG